MSGVFPLYIDSITEMKLTGEKLCTMNVEQMVDEIKLIKEDAMKLYEKVQTLQKRDEHRMNREIKVMNVSK